MIDSYKIYIDGILWRAYGVEAKFKAECYRLEKKLDTLCNERGGCLKTNVKIREARGIPVRITTYHKRVF